VDREGPVSTRWGVIGPGGIANQFADGMTLVGDGEIVAVASRSMERADAYGDRWGVAGRYDSAEALVDDADVDAVYVATPHSRHEADTLLALGAGKHVLCEKPFALNATQAQRMAGTARERGVFCMEALWTRFLPSYRLLQEVIADGRIGDVLLVEGDFGFRMPVQPGRHFDLELGGGALLDLGIYPIQLCTLLLGRPERIVADGVLAETGADEQVAAVMHFAGDRLGVVKAALRVPMSCTGRIMGTDGVIELPAFMHCPAWVVVNGERIDTAWEGEGLRFQVEEVHRCLAEGATESSVMPLDETVAIARILDEIRAQIGVVYPAD
jgi:predicted dehydrogenase